jgi:hypothetical protein
VGRGLGVALEEAVQPSLFRYSFGLGLFLDGFAFGAPSRVRQGNESWQSEEKPASSGVHTIGMMVPIDLIFLNKEKRAILRGRICSPLRHFQGLPEGNEHFRTSSAHHLFDWHLGRRQDRDNAVPCSFSRRVKQFNSPLSALWAAGF